MSVNYHFQWILPKFPEFSLQHNTSTLPVVVQMCMHIDTCLHELCIFFCQKPWLGPGQARAKPSVAALAGPMISAGQSRLKPSQSRGFWAKPGQANH
jgi:hypothetical protein